MAHDVLDVFTDDDLHYELRINFMGHRRHSQVSALNLEQRQAIRALLMPAFRQALEILESTGAPTERTQDKHTRSVQDRLAG